MESIVETIRLASRYQLFLGFIFGFITASVIHALLSAEHIRHVPSMVLRDPSVSFQKVYPASKGGSFDHSYASFMKNVQQMKTIFYLGAFFIITLLIVVVTFGLK